MLPALVPGVVVLANRLTGGAIGDIVQNAVTQVTGSEQLGQLAGIVTDAKTGNWAGAIQRSADFIAGIEDFKIEAELRWGPGAADRVCGTPGAVAECCPGPKDPFVVELGWSLGLIGYTVSLTFGEGESGACESSNGAAGPSSGFRGILDDPSLSLEAKVALLFAAMIDELDDEIESKLDDVAADKDDNRAATELQMLMQKRNQMYSLQSNMMSMFNDVSMQIINNVR